MASPNIIGAGPEVASVGAATYALNAAFGAAFDDGDVIMLVLETASEPPTPQIGWAFVPSGTVSTGAPGGAGSTGLYPLYTIAIRKIVTPNAGTDIFTATVDTRLLLGQEVMYASTGTFPTAVGGNLNGTTVYYAVPQTSTTFKLARTLADALANITIDITGVGTGTQRILTGSTTIPDVGDHQLSQPYWIRNADQINSFGDTQTNVDLTARAPTAPTLCPSVTPTYVGSGVAGHSVMGVDDGTWAGDNAWTSASGLVVFDPTTPGTATALGNGGQYQCQTGAMATAVATGAIETSWSVAVSASCQMSVVFNPPHVVCETGEAILDGFDAPTQIVNTGIDTPSQEPFAYVVSDGVPIEVAQAGTICIDTANARLYQNVDGGTTWIPIGRGAELNLGSLALGATVNNWAPPGYAGENFISVTTSTGGGSILTGLDLGAWQVNGFEIILVVTGANAITLADENLGSDADNRFSTVDNPSVIRGAVVLRYGGNHRWQAVTRWSAAS